ncbi:cytidylyltransferase domain-containing protein [Aquimarina aquimarini]|uniref:acylneuraminate cytidylyltransferase family protein n=1 Tax=Aquimarina aquimarini TaxID=1191734 RepID=UPI00131EEE7A|nr:acylneuraminate cytidylyltransferase [Aquimarina aquimarini]
MRDLGVIVLHIPAREGSKRVPRKNMRLMNNKPMIYYTISAAITANITNEIYVNTDSQEIEDYVSENFPNVKIYKREKNLADDNSSSDEFNYDIIQKLSPDTLIMINPVCPLIDSKDIENAVEFFKNNEGDTLISASSTQMQTFCNDEPVNINVNEQLAPSQDNKKIVILNWAVTIWDSKSFIDRMKTKNYAVLGDNRLLFEIEPLKGLKVSEEKDFILIENILKSRI